MSLGSTEHPPTYYEFVGVRGCQDVLHLYRLLWASAALNVLGVLLGIFTAAVLGAFKDMVSGPGCWPSRQPGLGAPVRRGGQGGPPHPHPQMGKQPREDCQQGVRTRAGLRRRRRSGS